MNARRNLPRGRRGEPVTTAGHVAAALALLLAASPALADDAAEIRARFEQWADDFNAKRIEPVCDLFSKELVSTVRNQGDKDYAFRCDLLTKSLTDPARQYHYDVEIHEVIVEDDLAVVRLTWTLFVTPLNVTAVEPGIDVLRKEADGAWRIIRYLSYEEES
ncbi:MAG TPA: nuclear transport factor 2 family protein [Bauldia sp.]|nr:nuclear transport factor 2 family protein [Bauldia sp.]